MNTCFSQKKLRDATLHIITKIGTRYFLYFLCFFCCAYTAHAQVQISEIAWMGTMESQYGEWIELYNDSAETVSLADWKLYEAGGATVVFTFSKSIDPHGYLLLERTTASSPDPVPGIDDESGTFGGSGFSNSGEHLVLKDENGNVIQDADFSSGWPAGDATTKETMQWNGSEWITAPATPDRGTVENTDSNTATDTTNNTAITSTSHIVGASPNEPALEFSFPSTVYKDVSYTFTVTPILEYHFIPGDGFFYWNMGDGTIVRQSILAPVVHRYAYSGSYTVYFAYYHRDGDSDPVLEGTKTVLVSVPTLNLHVVENNAVAIENTTPTTVDLTGWSMLTQDRAVLFPSKTIIAPHTTITIAFATLMLSPTSSVTLADPSGVAVASTIPISNPQPVRKNNAIFKTETTQPAVVALSTAPALVQNEPVSEPQKRNRTSIFLYGAVLTIIVALFVLLERFMASRE